MRELQFKATNLMMFYGGPWDGEVRRFSSPAPQAITVTGGFYHMVPGTWGPSYHWQDRRKK